MSTKAIFTPIKVGNNKLQHRVVLAPLTRMRATLNAVPTDLQVEYYKQRASEGSLLITEATFIDRLTGGYTQVPGIYNKEQIEGWKKVTAAVHEKKAVIYLQLWHIGRAGPKLLNPNHEQTLCFCHCYFCPLNGGGAYEAPRALEIEEIKAIVEQYRRAVLNAIEAGFDAVEIDSVNGYLLNQFINTSSNKRTDIYDGPVENRARFALEALDAVVETVGPEHAAIRFSPGEAFQDMEDEDVIGTWSCLTSEIQRKHPNLSYLHFVQARANIQGENLGEKTVTSPDTLGPFIAASGFSTVTEHAIDLAEKTGELIAFGRAFIANPDLPEHLRNGWELNKYNRDTFYTCYAEGYTGYPFHDDAKN